MSVARSVNQTATSAFIVLREFNCMSVNVPENFFATT